MTHVLSRFIDPTVLKDHEMIVGLLDIPGAGRRVATWDGLESRHMSAAAARRLAESLMEGETAVALRPVAEALLEKADLADPMEAISPRLAHDARSAFTGNLPDLSARA